MSLGHTDATKATAGNATIEEAAPDGAVRDGRDTIAETGPGISDDAALEGELAPGELGAGSDAQVERLKREGWAPPSAEDAEAQVEAHPS